MRRLSVSARPSIDDDFRTCSVRRKVYDITVLSVSLVSLLMLSVTSSMLLGRYTWHAIDVLRLNSFQEKVAVVTYHLRGELVNSSLTHAEYDVKIDCMLRICVTVQEK